MVGPGDNYVTEKNMSARGPPFCSLHAVYIHGQYIMNKKYVILSSYLPVPIIWWPGAPVDLRPSRRTWIYLWLELPNTPWLNLFKNSLHVHGNDVIRLWRPTSFKFMYMVVSSLDNMINVVTVYYYHSCRESCSSLICNLHITECDSCSSCRALAVMGNVSSFPPVQWNAWWELMVFFCSNFDVITWYLHMKYLLLTVPLSQK